MSLPAFSCMATPLNDARPLRMQVREETRELHDALDSEWWTSRGFASKQRYLAFLRAAQEAHSRFGIAAASARADGSDRIEQARRLALILDLEEETPQAMPDCDGVDISFAWGVGYALNGSALGASKILKSGDLDQDWPRRYLELGQRFARSGAVRKFFDDLNVQTLERDKMINGATAVFSLFKRHLETIKIPGDYGKPEGANP